MEGSDSFVIRTEGLSKTYKETKALDTLNLQVPRNSIFGFLGPNGAGKSTTIKLLLGLIQPSAGVAEVFGKDIRRSSLAQEPHYYLLRLVLEDRGVLSLLFTLVALWRFRREEF